MPLRYDMPATFGPSLMPDVTKIGNTMTIMCSFETEPEAIAPLLPRYLTPGESPVVTVSAFLYPATNYMGGRGYNELVISVPARGNDGGETLTGGFAPVVWVDQFGALVAGREFQGLPKLLGAIDIDGDPRSGYRFRCAEYEASLVRGSVAGLEPLLGDRLDSINRAAATVAFFGWKYIPSPAGDPDADYPTVNYTSWSYDRAWTGTGTAEFLRPTARAAPFASRILSVFAALPMKRWRKAFVGQGTIVIDRTITRRLAG